MVLYDYYMDIRLSYMDMRLSVNEWFAYYKLET